jgi:hypothetical protein
MLGTGDHYSIMIASKLDGLLSESGANLEHRFGAAKWGQGLLQDSGDVQRSSQRLRSLRAQLPPQDHDHADRIFARGARGQGVSRTLLPQALVISPTIEYCRSPLVGDPDRVLEPHTPRRRRCAT